MKIAIITLFHENYNYGAALQAYALQKAFESLGNDVTVLDYERTAVPIDPVDNSISGKVKRKLGSVESYADCALNRSPGHGSPVSRGTVHRSQDNG